MTRKTLNSSVCIIGAGLSGLTCIKSMQDAGLHVTCFEKENHIGGMWDCRSNTCVPFNTITNTTHIVSGFSDFPMPNDFSYYVTVSEYCRFLNLYAKHFNLETNIKFNCNVVSADPIYNLQYDSTENVTIKKWKIAYKDALGTLLVEEFDYLVLTTGFCSTPYIPSSLQSTIKDFNGTVTHSLYYKDWKQFEGKKVVVCGLGSSGCKYVLFIL